MLIKVNDVVLRLSSDPMKLVDEHGEYVLTKSKSWIVRLFMRICTIHLEM